MPAKVTNHPQLRTIRFTANGTLTDDEIDVAGRECKVATDSYKGKKHLVLADMRGLKTSSPSVAKKMGELIAYQRTHGVSLCVHLSDESVTRLQMERLSRKASPHDGAMIDVVSLEEAERVLSETRLKLNK